MRESPVFSESPFGAGVRSVGRQAGLVRWSGGEASSAPPRTSARVAVHLSAEPSESCDLMLETECGAPICSSIKVSRWSHCTLSLEFD